MALAEDLRANIRRKEEEIHAMDRELKQDGVKIEKRLELLLEDKKQLTILLEAGLGLPHHVRRGYGVGGGAAAPDIVTAVRTAVAAELDVRLAPRLETRSFSDVSATTADELLQELNIIEVDALESDKLVVPDLTPTCSDFHWAPGSAESDITPALLQHHQEQLQLQGVSFGRGGFCVYDVRSLTDCLAILNGHKEFKGTFGGCVAPYALMGSSAVDQCRIVYEHKRTPLLDACRGQVIVKLLAAYANAPAPVLLDLTDGANHTLLTIRGRKLFVWEGLTSTQAYYMQAQHLQSVPDLKKRTLLLDEVPEPQQTWVRNVRQKLIPPFDLKEQLDSIVPFLPPEKRVSVAFELIHAWGQRQQEPPRLPDYLRDFCA